MAINLAMGNTFTVNLHNGTKMLGVMHGSYGVGGTIGPREYSIFFSIVPSFHFTSLPSRETWDEPRLLLCFATIE